MRIGFIGLGVMGAPMARNLAAAGHGVVTTLNRSPLPRGLAAEVVDSPADVGRASEVVITMLPDTPDELMDACAARDGGAEADHSSLVCALESLSGHELAEGKA